MSRTYFLHAFTEDAEGVTEDHRLVAQEPDFYKAVEKAEDFVATHRDTVVTMSNWEGRVLERFQSEEVSR